MEAYVMDAFSARIFGGNQAGVVLPDRPLSDAVMRQIAAEFKHSETAFVTREPDGSVSLRYFTPAGEVELCGHATVASFALLRQLGRPGGRKALDSLLALHTPLFRVFGALVSGVALTERLFSPGGQAGHIPLLGSAAAAWLLSCAAGAFLAWLGGYRRDGHGMRPLVPGGPADLEDGGAVSVVHGRMAAAADDLAGPSHPQLEAHRPYRRGPGPRAGAGIKKGRLRNGSLLLLCGAYFSSTTQRSTAYSRKRAISSLRL